MASDGEKNAALLGIGGAALVGLFALFSKKKAPNVAGVTQAPKLRKPSGCNCGR
jgi:LPXTG-motif cell wall-anchored protein